MNPLQSGIPQQHYTAPALTRQTVAASGSQIRHPHPVSLSPASLSHNAHLALDQTEAQPSGHHKLMALLAHNGIVDGTMQLHSTQGADAHYRQQVSVPPENDIAAITVRARLNGQAQYDIVGIDLHVPSSGKSESLTLSALPSDAPHRQAPATAKSAGTSVSVPGPDRNTKLSKAERSRLSMQKRAREMTGDPNASAADYTRLMRQERARKITGDPNASAADYNRLNKQERARKITGDPNASAADCNRLNKQERAREMTGDPNASAADYTRLNKQELARKITGDPNASAADYTRLNKQELARKMTGDPNASAADYNRINKQVRAREITGNPNASAADYERIKRQQRNGK